MIIRLKKHTAQKINGGCGKCSCNGEAFDYMIKGDKKDCKKICCTKNPNGYYIFNNHKALCLVDDDLLDMDIDFRRDEDDFDALSTLYPSKRTGMLLKDDELFL